MADQGGQKHIVHTTFEIIAAKLLNPETRLGRTGPLCTPCTSYTLSLIVSSIQVFFSFWNVLDKS